MTLSLTEVQKLLANKAEYFRRTYGVKKIGIFGSYARNQANLQSDIDLLVEFSQPIGWEIVDLHHELEGLLGLKVDLVTIPALKPQLKTNILNEVVYV